MSSPAHSDELEGRNIARKLRLAQVVPFDIGRSVDKHEASCLRDRFSIFPEFVSEQEAAGLDASAAFLFSLNGALSELYVFHEGIAIIHIEHSEENIDSVTDIDPSVLNDLKRTRNRTILDKSHSHSGLIDRIRSTISSALGFTSRRTTSLDEFEHGGLSYSFAYFTLVCPHSDLSECVENVIPLCLFPHSKRGSSKFKDFEYVGEYVTSVDALKLQRISPDTFVELERTFDFVAYSSWSSLFIAGDVTPEASFYHKKTQISLQRVWYYAYILGKSVDSIADKIANTSLDDLLLLQHGLAEMTFKARKLDAMFSSVSSNRHFRIRDGLRKSSRLDRLLEGVENDSRYLIEQIKLRIEQNRIRSSKIIEFILLALAGMQALSAYEQMRQYQATKQFDIGWPEVVVIFLVVSMVIFVLRKGIRGG